MFLDKPLKPQTVLRTTDYQNHQVVYTNIIHIYIYTKSDYIESIYKRLLPGIYTKKMVLVVEGVYTSYTCIYIHVYM